MFGKKKKTPRSQANTRKKIKFKRTFYGGKQVESEGYAYETKDGIKVAVHRLEDGGWAATELSTGRLAVPQSYRTINEVKAKLEELSPTLTKLLKTEKEQKHMKDDKKRKTTRAEQNTSPKSGKNEPKQAKKPATPADKANVKKPTPETTPTSESKTKKPAANIPKRAPAAQKPSAIQKPAEPSKTIKPAATSKPPKKSDKPKLTPIKHNDADENKIGGESPVLILRGKKHPKPRASRRELKRVAKVGGYTVFDGARAGKTFATLEEAKNYVIDVLMRTGEIVQVAKTDRQITHTFRPEEQKKK